MLNFKILDFLINHTQSLSVLNCSSNYEYTEDLFELIMSGQYCASDIDLGIVFLSKTYKDNYIIVDGKRRILSMLILLKALSIHLVEMSSPSVSVLANQIESRYLKNSSNAKLVLFGFEKTVFEKILNNTPLSYNEKQTEIYRVLQVFLDNLRNMEIDVSDFCNLLERISIKIVFQDSYNSRDLFYLLNKSLRSLNQMMLIKSYLSEVHNSAELVDNLYSVFAYKEDVFIEFMKAYLSPKFNHMIVNSNLLYDYFTKYIETIKKYQNIDEIVSSIYKTAKIYKKMYNAEYVNKDIRNMFIKLISNDGLDTLAYLLELCEDFENDYVSEETLIEIGNIINTYVTERKRKDSLTLISFSQMAGELNKIIYHDNKEDSSVEE